MKLGITMLIHNKDDIEFVTEFPCLLGHPAVSWTFHYTYIGINMNLKSLNLKYQSSTTLGCKHRGISLWQKLNSLRTIFNCENLKKGTLNGGS